MREIQPAWIRSFLDEEEPCIIHVIKSGHRTEKHENLFIMIREDPHGTDFIGLLDAAEINNRFNIIL